MNIPRVGVVSLAAGYSALLGLYCPGESRCLGLITGLDAVIHDRVFFNVGHTCFFYSYYYYYCVFLCSRICVLILRRFIFIPVIVHAFLKGFNQHVYSVIWMND